LKILDRLFGRKRKKRSYEASGVGRLLQNWTTAIKTPDEELRTSLRNLRARVEEHPHKNRRSAIDYYGKNYMDKLLKVTGGRVLHDYINRKGVNHV